VTRLVHLSDLHFGRADQSLTEPLLAAVRHLAPDLTVISGDLTQRARHSQFARARALIDRLPGPVLSVPGNHDIPLDNLFVRFLRPFGRYRRYIDRDLEPEYRDETMAVAGVNTVNRWSWQRGKIGRGRLARLSARLAQAPQELKIAVLHHPLEHGPETDKRLMRGAARTLEVLADHGANLVLSGHLHRASARPFRAAPDLLFVEAGTGLSTRLRHDQRNTFNLLDFTGDRLEVVTWGTTAATPDRFTEIDRAHWRHGPQGWSAVDAPAPEASDRSA
jgi:3',5'-cyclic AMP phosphodiesterase CpdA